MFFLVEAYYSPPNLYTLSNKEVGFDYDSQQLSLRVRTITHDKLVFGPLDLEITFEFRENLVVTYFRNPNLYNQKLDWAIEEGPRGLTLAEFTKRKCLYLTLTSLLKHEEIKYKEHYLVDGFESYVEEEWPYSQPYPIWHFGGIGYALVPGPTEFYYKFAEVKDLEISSALSYSSCIYHQPKALRSQHSATKCLILDCYHSFS